MFAQGAIRGKIMEREKAAEYVTGSVAPRRLPPAANPVLAAFADRSAQWPGATTADAGAAGMARKIAQVRQRLRDSQIEMLGSLIAVLEAKDPYTAHHSMRVAVYAEELARRMHMSSSAVERIRTAALLHDIGKVGIPDAILTKPDALSIAEFEKMKEHSTLGAAILQPAGFFEGVVALVLHHHEWYDGSGYPVGLAGSAIPLGARLVHVADSIDAMLSPRCYRDGRSTGDVIDELRRNRGRQFDPLMADIAVAWLRRRP